MYSYLSTILLIPILLAIAWMYTAYIARASSPIFRNKRICLLIAHPDDEAMFFSPTLLALTDQDLGNHVKILCLSTGIPSPLCYFRPLSSSISRKRRQSWADPTAGTFVVCSNPWSSIPGRCFHP